MIVINYYMLNLIIVCHIKLYISFIDSGIRDFSRKINLIFTNYLFFLNYNLFNKIYLIYTYLKNSKLRRKFVVTYDKR